MTRALLAAGIALFAGIMLIRGEPRSDRKRGFGVPIPDGRYGPASLEPGGPS